MADERDALEVLREFMGRLRGLATGIDQRASSENLIRSIQHSLAGLPWVRSADSDFAREFERGGVKETALVAEQTMEHTLARLFLRLGPPPEPSGINYEPAGRGGGGVQQ
ncbi:hypothetical protein ACXNSR_15045 [Streptomyces sp. NC-S4]